MTRRSGGSGTRELGGFTVRRRLEEEILLRRA
jgi:hypothetical protein